MKELTELEASIKSYNGQILTTKKLNELGISKHYIKKLVINSRLEKISRGNYKVVTLKEEKKEEKIIQADFNLLKKNILEKNYQAAYQTLVILCNQKTNHDYEDHMFLYSLLLKEILGSEYDFSYLNNLLQFTYEYKIGSYFNDYVEFRENVMKQNFEKASEKLKNFKLEEKRIKGRNNISTLLFESLLETIHEKSKKTKELPKEKIKIPIINPQKNNDQYSQVKTLIEQNDYEKALSLLKECQKENNSSNKQLLAILLESYLEIMSDKAEGDKKKAAYYKENATYMNLVLAIRSKDFEMAHKITRNLSTRNREWKLIIKIIDDIYEIEKKKEQEENKTLKKEEIKSPKNQKALEEIKIKRYNYLYKQLQLQIEHEEYKKALSTIQECLDFSQFGNTINKELIKLLLEGIIALINNEINFEEEKEINYEGSAYQILKTAIKNEDYKTAFKNIGKCTYQNDDKDLNLMKQILHHMYEINKKKTKKVSKTDISKIKQKEEKLEPTKIKVEIKEENKEENINVLELYDLIYNREYAKAKEILTSMNKNTKRMDRVYTYTLRLIKQLETIKNNPNTTEIKEYTYEKNGVLKKTYEALRLNDFRTANEVIEEAIEKVENKVEFQIYKMILSDIVIFMDIAKLENQIIKKIKEKAEFNTEIVAEIENLMLEKNNCPLGENKSSEILNIIDVIYTTIERKLCNSDFEQLNNQKENDSETFDYALKNGDYLTSASIINKEKESLINKGYSKNELIIIKYLLNNLRFILNKNTRFNYSNAKIEEEIAEPTTSSKYATLKKLVKNRKFKEALSFYLDNQLFLSKENNTEVAANLICLLNIQEETEEEITLDLNK